MKMFCENYLWLSKLILRIIKYFQNGHTECFCNKQGIHISSCKFNFNDGI